MSEPTITNLVFVSSQRGTFENLTNLLKIIGFEEITTVQEDGSTQILYNPPKQVLVSALYNPNGLDGINIAFVTENPEEVISLAALSSALELEDEPYDEVSETGYILYGDATISTQKPSNSESSEE